MSNLPQEAPTPRFGIRPAAEEDIPQILELESLLFENAMNETMLRRELEVGTGLVWASATSGVVGYALLRRDEDLFDLTRLGVVPRAQGMGVGRRLLYRVLEMTAGYDIVLTVLKTNERAQKLYFGAGFQIVASVSASAAWVLRRAAASAEHP